jgi:hypothetical protein
MGEGKAGGFAYSGEGKGWSLRLLLCQATLQSLFDLGLIQILTDKN